MGLFGRKKKVTANDILAKQHDVYCHVCGIKLDPVVVNEEEVEDGTDDVYDLCPKCYLKFVEMLEKKGAK